MLSRTDAAAGNPSEHEKRPYGMTLDTTNSIQPANTLYPVNIIQLLSTIYTH
jgi:hypothetical protein